MPTISPVITRLDSENAAIVVWGPMANGDVGAPVPMAEYADRAVQVVGTFGVGGNAAIEGCLERAPANYAVLADVQGNALNFTSAKIEAVQELTTWIRPNVNGGDGTTALTVTMFMRRGR